MKAVIFDMDGTILDTIRDITDAVNFILDKYSLPTRSVDEVKYFVGRGLKRTLLLSVGDNESDDFVDKVYEEFVAYYKTHSNIHTGPYKGIVDAIKELKVKGYALAVVSNKRIEAVKELGRIYYDGLFDCLMGDEVGINIKPAPDMVLKALDILGVEKMDAVYIGDSDVDIQTASNAGLQGIYVSWGFRGRNFLIDNGAEIIVDTPAEMVSEINNILHC